MGLDLANPRERQLAMDRLAVGVRPTMRGSAMKERRKTARSFKALRDAGIAKQAQAKIRSANFRKSQLAQQAAQQEAAKRLKAQRITHAQTLAQARDDALRAKLQQRTEEQAASQEELVRRASARWNTPAPPTRGPSPPRNPERGADDDYIPSSTEGLQKGERYVDMDYVLAEGIRASTAAKRFSFPMLKLGKRVKTAAALEQESEALAEDLLNSFKAGLGDPFDLLSGPTGLDDDSSSEEEWDPKSKLPYMPRRKLDKRLANALIMIAAPLGQIERELRAHDREVAQERLLPSSQSRIAMQAVAAQIALVGTVQRSEEREEVGPAPHGFCYVQVNDQVYLTSEGGNGSMVYVGEADRIFICHRP
ncbi:hypothetical protein C8F04DRAFT_1264809 [Mycena alexandri]|uniref:Uncharacterized protein n=1 Tax=Mycena alexandri TaxID=1745969 RepID=A0AAD6SNI1_9AGAR|nr:hypothetical protein C8F04DRAFT_1264809 [Mycena alexandri]